MRLILLAALMLCGCAPTQPQSHFIAQKLAALPIPAHQVLSQVNPAPSLRTNTYKLNYPVNPAGRMWVLEASTNLTDWAPDPDYSMIGNDALVFASNSVPMRVWRVKLY